MATLTMQVQKIEYTAGEARLTAACVNGAVQGTLTISTTNRNLLRMFDAGDTVQVSFVRTS